MDNYFGNFSFYDSHNFSLDELLNSTFNVEDFQNERSDLQTFLLYATPVFIVIGWITNLVSLVLLCRKPLNASVSSALLSAYAVSSVIFLITVGVEWLGYEVYSNIPFSNAGCKIWYFSLYCLDIWPTWFIVAATCERCVALLCGRTCQHRLTVALVTIFGIMVVAGLFYVDILWKASTESIFTLNDDVVVCIARDDTNTAWVLIQHVLTVLIPLGVLMILGSFFFFLFVLRRHNSDGQDNESVEKQVTLIVVLAAFLLWISATPYASAWTIYYTSASILSTELFKIVLFINSSFRCFLLCLSLMAGKLFSKCHNSPRSE